MDSRIAGRLSLICGVSLALWGCSGNKPSSPTTPVENTMAGADHGSASAQDAEPKVTICHLPPGNPDNAQTITIGASAVPAHLANHPGDSVGPCTRPTPSPSPTPTPKPTPPPG
jgi:hypothetical protein